MPSPQHRRFDELRPRFEALYRAAAAHDATRFIDSQWSERNAELAADLLPEPPFSFIRHPVILYTMFVPPRYMGIELEFLRSRLDEETLRLALAEDPAGDPVLAPDPTGACSTSANLVHHLHHLERLAAATGVRPGQVDT